MAIRATGRTRILASRAIHRHYLARPPRPTSRAAASRSRSCPRCADGTTDLAALERALADGEPVAGVLLRPAQRVRRPGAHGGGGSPRPCRRCPVHRRRGAGLAGRARRPRGGRRGHRRGRGAAAGHPHAVRRPVPGHPRHHRGAHPPDPGPPRRAHQGPRRPARLRDDAARAGAGHPPRQGGQQHLHQPGAVRAGGHRLPRHDGPARPARRGGRRRRAGPQAGGRPGRCRCAARPRRRRTSTSSRCACRRRRRVHAALLEHGVLAGLPLADWYPDDPDLADGAAGVRHGGHHATTRSRASRPRCGRCWHDRRRRRSRPRLAALPGPLRGRGGAPRAAQRGGAHAPAHARRSCPCPAATRTRCRIRPPTRSRASPRSSCARLRRPCRSSTSRASCATSRTCRGSTTPWTAASTRWARAP